MGQVFQRYDAMNVEPTISNIKSHIPIGEAILTGKSSKDIDKWIISNEAADGAADAEADHQGTHEDELKAEGRNEKGNCGNSCEGSRQSKWI